MKKEVDADAEEDDDDDKENDEEKDDVGTKDDDEKEEEKKNPTKKTVFEWEQVNTQKAIWLRSKEDVIEEEYKLLGPTCIHPLQY